MKQSIFLSLLVLFFSCNQSKTVSEQPKRNKIEGTWKLVFNSVEENDSVTVKDLGNRDFIKIINESHFSFINQIPDSEEGFYAGAGTYSLNEDKYVEVLNYLEPTAWRGHKFEFTVSFSGDTLIQQGREDVPEAGIERFIVEKYLRVK